MKSTTTRDGRRWSERPNALSVRPTTISSSIRTDGRSQQLQQLRALQQQQKGHRLKGSVNKETVEFSDSGEQQIQEKKT